MASPTPTDAFGGSGGGGGSGTVTSFSASVPVELTQAVVNPTTTPQLVLDWAAASGNKFIGGPADGSSGQYAGRALVALDVAPITTVWQPLDADLTAIAALSTTSYGRGFLTAADAAAGRTYLGLGSLATQSGTFSGTSSGTNTGDQTITLTGDVTGSGTGSFATTIGAGKVTEAMQVLANNTTGNVSTTKHGYAPILPNDATKYLDGTGAWTVPAGGGSSYAGTIVTLTDASTIAINGNDWGISGVLRVTIAADGHTFGAPSNPHDNQTMRLEIVTAAVRTLAWNSAFSGDTIPLPTSTTGGGLVDCLFFVYRSAESKWLLQGSTLATADTGATTSLDNLGSVAINAAMNPGADAAIAFGTKSLRFTEFNWSTGVFGWTVLGDANPSNALTAGRVEVGQGGSHAITGRMYRTVDPSGTGDALGFCGDVVNAVAATGALGQFFVFGGNYGGCGVLASTVSGIYLDAANAAYCIRADGAGNLKHFHNTTEYLRHDGTNVRLLKATFPGIFAAIGDAAPACRFGGNHQVNSTPVASTNSGSEQDLQSITLPAGLLVTAKDVVSFEMVFTFAANATTKQIKAYLGSTAIFDSGALAFNGGSATLYGTIVRTGAATQRVSVTFAGNTTLLAATSQYTDVTETLANALALKGTVTLGLGAAANDAIQKLTVARYEPVGA